LSRAGDVRICDLAAELGLTKGTVSRAINGYEDISKNTRQRVMEAAGEFGFRIPNQLSIIAMTA
jgi:LacI family transcriptional regulator